MAPSHEFILNKKDFFGGDFSCLHYVGPVWGAKIWICTLSSRKFQKKWLIVFFVKNCVWKFLLPLYFFHSLFSIEKIHLKLLCLTKFFLVCMIFSPSFHYRCFQTGIFSQKRIKLTFTMSYHTWGKVTPAMRLLCPWLYVKKNRRKIKDQVKVHISLRNTSLWLQYKIIHS